MELANELANSNFHSAEGMTAEQYEAASKQTLAALQAAQAARNAQTAATGCTKPLLNFGKKKKAYEQCLADNKKAANTPVYTPAPYTPSAYTPTPSTPFFKTGAGIAVIVVGSLALAIGTFLAIKHFKK